MEDEPILLPSKHEMIRILYRWIVEKSGIEFADINLNKMSESDIQILWLASGRKLDMRHVTRMQEYARRQWEYTHGKQATRAYSIEHNNEGE